MMKGHTRQAITHEERFQLQKYKENNKAATQEQCAEWFFKTYGKKISQSTVSDSLNSRRHKSTPITDIRNPTRSRDGKPKWPKLETPLYERARFELENGRPVTKPMLAKWATEMFSVIYPEVQPVPSFSIGMMARFADRNGIFTTPSKEKHSVSPPASMDLSSMYQSPQKFQHPGGSAVPCSHVSQIPHSGSGYVFANVNSMEFQGGASMIPINQLPMNENACYDSTSNNPYASMNVSPQYMYPPGYDPNSSLQSNIGVPVPGGSTNVAHHNGLIYGQKIPQSAVPTLNHPSSQMTPGPANPVYVQYDQNFRYMQCPQDQPFPGQYAYNEAVPFSSSVHHQSAQANVQPQRPHSSSHRHRHNK